ncbi:MAG: N-formylglutamate amidohydrolase [Candidatus Marinimicrobia bacterium]|nr:N-formylglutamate amidohydrolase [Candidatus Neomarinimicrobiota bacterium]
MSNIENEKLIIAFESEKLTYSGFDVDLYNTGITQILSVAATRGHKIYHFNMEDLYWHDNAPHARASVLELPQGWVGEPITAHQFLSKTADRPLNLAKIDICFVRGDDIRDVNTLNLDLFKTIDQRGVLFESIKATLVTTDKYELVKRLSDIPQPKTYPASSMAEAQDALTQIPNEHSYFIIKDRFGFGCGLQVHRVRFSDPELDKIIDMYLSKYKHIILQEFCPEVKNGDIVITFFDGELIAPMLREPAFEEWKTNLSFGGNQIVHVLTNAQEHIARTVINAFPEIRYASVDMLSTGKVLEINAFPGGEGLYKIYGVSVGAIIMDKLESEMLHLAPPPTEISVPLVEQPITPWSDVYSLYEKFETNIEVLDVFCDESYSLPIQDLIDFTPRSNDYILSVPHSGILIPEQFTNKFDLGSKCLKEVDMLSDVLYEGLDGLQVVSRLAAFFIDMNRTRDGLKDKTLPFHLTNSAIDYYTIENELLRQQQYTSEEREYVISFYDLYHDIIKFLAQNMINERGYSLIIDAHSMSSVGWGRVHDQGKKRSNFVVGTLDDESADSEIIHAFCDALKNAAIRYNLGLSLAKNDPYSGGFITRKHNDPDNNIHVIQLEVTMETYMFEADAKDKVKRYALKQPRLKIVQDIISHAIESASMTAKKIYS